MNKAIVILIIVLTPAIAVADSGEGFIEMLVIQVLRLFNVLWPFLLPFGLLGRARKKPSFYLYSLVTCGATAGLLTYFLPQQVLSWLNPEFTVTNLRIAMIYMVVATCAGMAICVSLSRYIREFNDSHD